jgi:hypothetical protein
MAKKADNYFVKVAKYQKEHPRASREQAMKAVSKSIAGGKKRSVGAVVVKPRKRSVTETERITAVGKSKKHNPVQQGISISKRIEDLEILLKNTRGVQERNKVKHLINAEHDKLDAITKRLRSA